jgi:hemerythrin-like metal-binding protein
MQSIDIFPWDDNFATGLAIIDEQHRRLVQLLNKLASHVAFQADDLELQKIFDDLTDYTVYHFETEEGIWHRYLPGEQLETDHRHTHQRFIATVCELKAKLVTHPAELVADQALGFLARWLASHILESDRYMAYMVAALDQGLDATAARHQADRKMSGANRVLIGIILSIYETLSSNTLHLMREIAEHKRHQAELSQARQQAEAANIAKSRFLANMSHEIRTPMNGILGMAQLLLEDGVSDQERREFAATILSSGGELLGLLNDLLDLAQLEAGNLELEVGVFRPGALLDDIREEFADRVREKGLELALEMADAPDESYSGDSRRIAQMLRQLTDNAVKFTQQGQIRLGVQEVSREESAALLEFTVSDSGIGLDRHVQPLLFRPFTQGDDSATRSQPGAGLGLAIVRGLARLMAGQAGADNQPLGGSRFWFRVPVQPIAQD